MQVAVRLCFQILCCIQWIDQVRVLLRSLGQRGLAEDADVLQRAELIVGHGAVVVKLVHLPRAQPQHEIDGSAVTHHAFGAAWKMPNLLPPASRDLRIADRESVICAGRGDECGVCLLIIPLVRIALPLALLPREQACFDPTLRSPLAGFHVERECLYQHGAFRECPAVSCREFNLRRAWQGDPAPFVVPSDQTAALTEYGISAGSGRWSAVETNSPVSLRRVGNFAGLVSAGVGSSR